jgi:hypothetical protein
MEMDYVAWYDLQDVVIVALVAIILKREILIVVMKLQ